MSIQLPVVLMKHLNIWKMMKSIYSCLLVNRIYCEIAVEILWKNILDFQNGYEHSFKSHISLLFYNRNIFID
jgi:hypothetical protein